MGKWLVFDVESVVDAKLLNDVKYRGQGLTPEKAVARATREALDKHGNDFLPYSFHYPVSIATMWLADDFSCLAYTALPLDQYNTEADRLRSLVSDFWYSVETEKPRLISYNGRSFDLPLLELMGFRYGLNMRSHFTEKYGARYRFGDNHVDLHEFMTNYGAARMAGGLDLLSKLLGRTGKAEVSGSDVGNLYQLGDIKSIDSYCMRDVLDTYAIFLRSRTMLGMKFDEAKLLDAAEKHLTSYLAVSALTLKRL